MKAVILCAGRSTRTHPLTVDIPKPMLKIQNKTILDHNIEALKGTADEIIIVVGHEKDKIIDHISGLNKKAGKTRISYIEQKRQSGTGNAVLCTENLVKGRFILMLGDNIYRKHDIRKMLKRRYAMLANEVENPELYGVLNTKIKKSYGSKTEKMEVLYGIEEKPEFPLGNLINSGCYLLDDKIFSHLKSLKKTKRGEYEFTDALTSFAKDNNIEIIRSEVFHISHPWDLLDANEKLNRMIKRKKILGTVEKYVTIKGNVIVGKGTTIKSGSYIEGPAFIGEDCTIGPNCYVRGGSTIGNRCKIGNAVEIKNSILMDDVSVGHLSYMGDTIIGHHTNIGAGTITANLRHDNKNISSHVKEKLTDSGRRKLGAIIGNNVHTGIHTSILPGRKIWPNESTYPGEILKKDMINRKQDAKNTKRKGNRKNN